MRILYLANSAQIGGGNRFLLALARAVRARGGTPIIVVPAEGPMAAACRDLGVACEVRGYPDIAWRAPLGTWESCRAWRQLLKDLRIDLIHANDPSNARSIAVAAFQSRRPLVCHVHFHQDPAFVRWAFRLLPKPDVLLFNSDAMQQEMAFAFLRACPRAPQIVVHNGVSLDEFRPGPEPIWSPPRVGIVANLLPVKGHLDFLQMASMLRAKGVDARYWIVGEDIHRTGYGATLTARAADYGLEQEVSFLGFRENVSEVLQQLDIVVCASHAEPFGLCLIEAMACGKAVVGTQVGGIPEIIEPGISGLLVPPRDPAALADAVERLIRDQELRRRIGAAGRRRVETSFSHSVCTQKILCIYEELLAGREALTIPDERAWKNRSTA